MEIIAHSQQQYNSWKNWRKKDKDSLFMLARNYHNEITSLVGYLPHCKLSDEEIFDLIAKNIKPPCKDNQ